MNASAYRSRGRWVSGLMMPVRKDEHIALDGVNVRCAEERRDSLIPSTLFI